MKYDGNRENNEQHEKGNKPDLTRREFLKSTAILGAGILSLVALNDMSVLQVGGENSQASSGYSLNSPENIIYSVCLQCNTTCAIKVKHRSDGKISKIDGNPYSPQTMLPWLNYDINPQLAASVDGKLCPKGQSGIQSYADPYRIVKVLKRAGPRGSNKWQVISFEQAIKEIVNGGKLFAHLGEDREVPGFKDVFVLRDAKLSAAMAADVALIQQGKMSVADFKTKYSSNLNVLIDPDHPDLGPKNNQFVFLAGRIQPGRAAFAQRFTYGALGSVNWFNHTSICELSHHIAYQWSTAQYVNGKWLPGIMTAQPNYLESEFLIFWGAGVFEATFGPTPISEQITSSLTSEPISSLSEARSFKFAVIDPRFSKLASKAWRWIPVVPGGDLPLALAMIQWIIENNRYNRDFLQNANKAAAIASGQKSWTNATWLVKIEADGTPGSFLRAADIGLQVPEGKNPQDYFVVLSNGVPIAFDPYDSVNKVVGDLLVDTIISGIHVKSALQIIREVAKEKTIEDWAKMAGVDPKAIVELAAEFTNHGPRAAIEFYRGAVKHWNGYYTAQAIIILNLLIGNPDWKGGLSVGGGSWNALGTNPGQPFNLLKLHPDKLTPFGVKITREGSFYENSTLFKGYPAKRPWYPFTSNLYHEVLPSAKDAYPYGIKILWLHMSNLAQLTPAGTEQIAILRDTNAIPLIIATDIVIGDTSMYADYIFPDLSYLECWDFMEPPPSIITKTSLVRQPAAIPVPEIVTIDGEDMPISMEAVMIAIAKALNAPGYGPNGFAPGLPFNRPEDFYLKAVANIAYGDSADDHVPDADPDEISLFLKARRYLPPAVFNPQKWQMSVGAENWARVIYVLNRGGRFESPNKAYNGPYLNHTWSKLWNIYVEPVALGINSITGKRFSGVPRYTPPSFSDGSPLPNDAYDFFLSTFKEIFGAKRTVSNYWSQLLILPSNFILMNVEDAKRLGLKDGDTVRLVSASNPTGSFDLGPALGRRFVEGKLKLIQGIRPGVIAVSLSYGHWNYGAADVTIDGIIIRGDKRRGAGLIGNPVLFLDKVTGTSLTDPIGGSVSFFDTKVKVIKVG
jgi:anaerobic selenocysteine-containing dehydrogenase